MQMGRMMNRNLFRTWVCFSVHSWRSMVSWWKRRYFNLLNTQILHTVFYTFPFALMRRILLLTCGYPMGIPRVFFMGFDMQMCHSLTLRQRRSALRLRPELTARYENNIVHCRWRASELSIRLCILVREPWEFIIIIIIFMGKKIRDSMGFKPITGYCISTAVLDQWNYEHPHIKSRMISMLS